MARWPRRHRAERDTDQRSGGRDEVRKTGSAEDTVGPRPPCRLELLLGRPLRLGQSEEELLAAGKRDVSADGTRGTVLGLVALDRDLGSGRQRLLRQAEPVEIVRARA